MGVLAGISSRAGAGCQSDRAPISATAPPLRAPRFCCILCSAPFDENLTTVRRGFMPNRTGLRTQSPSFFPSVRAIARIALRRPQIKDYHYGSSWIGA